jgi:hypothetical protein
MDKPKLYKYIGSEEIRLSVLNCVHGTVIKSIEDLRSWIETTNNFPKGMIRSRKTITINPVVATFVIDLNGELLLADRHSEHVACAGGLSVLSAGEIFISRDAECFQVSDVTNQSTGYCPEIESWKYVEAALHKIKIHHPSYFTIEFTFRRCCSCSQINIVKDNLFTCLVCNSILSDEWNFI